MNTHPYSLVMTETQHGNLREHLFTADGFESAAILVCSRAGFQHQRLCVNNVMFIPSSSCAQRSSIAITWSGEWIERAINIAEKHDQCIVLVHSHPGGSTDFSTTDDESDQRVIPSLFNAIDAAGVVHGSAIMVSSGVIHLRLYNRMMRAVEAESIVAIGENIVSWHRGRSAPALPFTDAMRDALESLTACVVGVSGTGSLVAEMLARSGIGKLILIDFDQMEFRNLNRIVNSTVTDVAMGSFKTYAMAEAIRRYRPDIELMTLEVSVDHPDALRIMGDADVLFSCVDTMEGRHWCDVIARAYLLPMIDLGVSVPTFRTRTLESRIAEVCARIDYVFPGGSTLADRGVTTAEGLQREYQYRVDPQAALELEREGYIRGMPEEAPPVMSINCIAASFAVNEWLARAFPYRIQQNRNYARVLLSLASMEQDNYDECDFQRSSMQPIGMGLEDPTLTNAMQTQTEPVE